MCADAQTQGDIISGRLAVVAVAFFCVGAQDAVRIECTSQRISFQFHMVLAILAASQSAICMQRNEKRKI